MVTEGNAHVKLLNHCGPVIPIFSKNVLIQPASGLKILDQEIPATALDTVRGKKNMARKIPIPLTFQFNKTAKRKPPKTVGKTPYAKYWSERPNAGVINSSENNLR